MSQRPNAAGKNHLHRLRALSVVTIEAGGQSQARLLVRPSNLRRGLGQQSFACAINKSQALFAIKSKDGDVNFGHHRSQQRGGFHRAESLFAQRLAQVVYFQHHFAERVAQSARRPRME